MGRLQPPRLLGRPAIGRDAVSDARLIHICTFQSGPDVTKRTTYKQLKAAVLEREKEDAYAQGRRAGLEEAAQVADAYEPQCDTCPRGVVNAIRALATEEKR